MKRRKVTPVGKRSGTPSMRSEQPAKLKDFVEDPLPEKRNTKAEQKAAANRKIRSSSEGERSGSGAHPLNFIDPPAGSSFHHSFLRRLM
jgi:hypothetical protein